MCRQTLWGPEGGAPGGQPDSGTQHGDFFPDDLQETGANEDSEASDHGAQSQQEVEEEEDFLWAGCGLDEAEAAPTRAEEQASSPSSPGVTGKQQADVDCSGENRQPLTALRPQPWTGTTAF